MSRHSLWSVLVILAIALTACGPKAGETVDLDLTAILSEVEGDVQARGTAESELVDATNGMVIQVLGQVRTGDSGRARLDLSSGTLIRVAPASLFTLESNQPVAGGLDTRFKLEFGRLWIILNGGSAEVETPSGVASVRGSYLMVEVLPDGGVQITCLEGDCILGNGAGSANLTAGQTAIITNFSTPPVTGKMTDEDVAAWLAANPEATQVVVPLTPTAASEEPTNTPTPSATPLPTSGQATVLLNSRCRSGPGTNYSTLLFLSAGDLVTIVGKYSDWFLIETGAPPTQCWVYGNALQANFEVSGIPPVEPPPTPTPVPVPPEFRNLSGPIGSYDSCNVPVFSVDVIDLDGVQEVWLYFEVGYNSEVYVVYATGAVPVPGDGINYQIAYPIPAYPYYDVVEWWFLAIDRTGMQAVSTAQSYTPTAYCSQGY